MGRMLLYPSWCLRCPSLPSIPIDLLLLPRWITYRHRKPGCESCAAAGPGRFRACPAGAQRCGRPGSRSPLPRRSLRARRVPRVGRAPSPRITRLFHGRIAVIRRWIVHPAPAGSRRLCGPSGSCGRGALAGSGAGCASPPDPGCRRPGGAGRGGPAAGAAPSATPTATPRAAAAPPAPAGSGGGPWPARGGRSPARGARHPAAAAGGARLTRRGGGSGNSSGRTDGRTDGHPRPAPAGGRTDGGSEGSRYAGCGRAGIRAGVRAPSHGRGGEGPSGAAGTRHSRGRGTRGRFASLLLQPENACVLCRHSRGACSVRPWPGSCGAAGG